ncbi:hypothetical protein J3R30DRAFT_3553131 [Lentinula aciculospora]|uniref:Uncharacterized protein n=1 Tax=Lentinula aciculospora TaxID=153920 RepID=A0A9W8ZZ57_9AGAR|nr:hypothetical protein J3R30DRAFT_3553131 [Lentinula aciculospora]
MNLVSNGDFPIEYCFRSNEPALYKAPILVTFSPLLASHRKSTHVHLLSTSSPTSSTFAIHYLLRVMYPIALKVYLLLGLVSLASVAALPVQPTQQVTASASSSLTSHASPHNPTINARTLSFKKSTSKVVVKSIIWAGTEKPTHKEDQTAAQNAVRVLLQSAAVEQQWEMQKFEKIWENYPAVNDDNYIDFEVSLVVNPDSTSTQSRELTCRGKITGVGRVLRAVKIPLSPVINGELVSSGDNKVLVRVVHSQTVKHDVPLPKTLAKISSHASSVS